LEKEKCLESEGDDELVSILHRFWKKIKTATAKVDCCGGSELLENL